MKHNEGQFEHPQTQQAQEGEFTARSTPSSKKQLGTNRLEELAGPGQRAHVHAVCAGAGPDRYVGRDQGLTHSSRGVCGVMSPCMGCLCGPPQPVPQGDHGNSLGGRGDKTLFSPYGWK